jgi:hypothetical protein
VTLHVGQGDFKTLQTKTKRTLHTSLKHEPGENIVLMMIVQTMMTCVYLNMIFKLMHGFVGSASAVHHLDAVQVSHLKILWTLLSAISRR